jgi:hypothetical protein
VIGGDKLVVVSGISEYARRVRELRAEFGWPVLTGVAAKENQDEADNEKILDMKTDDYLLLSLEQDRDAAHRWRPANQIRSERLAVRNKILKTLPQ